MKKLTKNDVIPLSEGMRLLEKNKLMKQNRTGMNPTNFYFKKYFRNLVKFLDVDKAVNETLKECGIVERKAINTCRVLLTITLSDENRKNQIAAAKEAKKEGLFKK